MWIFGSKGPSGFSSSSTAEEVTQGIDGTGLTAIVTGASSGIRMETTRVLALRGVHVIMAVRNVDAGHFLLTDLLLETMKNTARESNTEGRVVNLSSEGHRFASSEGIRFDKINDESGYNAWSAYGQSKLANILHVKELARRLKEDVVEITANSVHPGAIRTNLSRHLGLMNSIGHIVGKFFLKNVQQGAATTCYVALNPQVKGVSGEYFFDCNIGNPSSKAKDADLAKRLWDLSFNFTNPK
ncbi:hypothetical protein V6N13_061207 [Hibiscus sabdariffa]